MSRKEDWLQKVARDDGALEYAPQELKNDRDVVLAAVACAGMNLALAGEVLKHDRQVVLIAVAQNGHSLQKAAELMKHDKEILLTAVAQNGHALRFASDVLKDNRDVVLTAVAQNGAALHDAGDRAKADRELVLRAIAQKVDALQYAADFLLEDVTFAEEARQEFHIFKVTSLSGHSCTLAHRFLTEGGLFFISTKDLVHWSRWKLGFQSTGREALVFGEIIVPAGPLDGASPGGPMPGKVVEYQLVM